MSGGEIDDLKAPMRESEMSVRVPPGALAIWAPMAHQFAHDREAPGQPFDRAAREVEAAGYPTHELSSPMVQELGRRLKTCCIY